MRPKFASTAALVSMVTASWALGVQDDVREQGELDGGAPASSEFERIAEIERLVGELRAARTDGEELRLAADGKVEEARSAISRLEREQAELELKREELQSELEAISAEVDGLRDKRFTQESALQSLGAIIDEASRHARSVVIGGSRFQLEDRLALLPVAGEPPADGLEQYLKFLAQELKLARSCEVYAADIPLGGGRIKPARVVRVGHLMQAFATEDGEEFGFQSADGWEVLESGNLEQSVIHAIEILDGRRAPKLIELPLRARVVQ